MQPENQIKPTLGQVVSIFEKEFIQKYPQPKEHRQILTWIKNCRTEEMGKRIEQCDECHERRTVYCSCRNRHCPECHAHVKAKWLFARTTEVLPVRYFHNVFTLPHELNGIILCNKKVMLHLLFSRLSETLLAFGRNPKSRLGYGELGFTLFLHTWSQTLMDHFHIHALIPGGILSEDGMEWIGVGRSKYLFNKENLALVFRTKFLQGLQKFYEDRKLVFPGKMEIYREPEKFRELIQGLYKKQWITYSKATLRNTEDLLEYLSQYTHRIAITNQRILSISEGSVKFKYLDRRAGNKAKEMALSGVEFLRRFTMHILPKKFMRVRSYGWMANRYKKIKLSVIRESLKQKEPEQKDFDSWYQKRLGFDPFCCPICKKGRMRIIQEKYRFKPEPKIPDTS